MNCVSSEVLMMVLVIPVFKKGFIDSFIVILFLLLLSCLKSFTLLGRLAENISVEVLRVAYFTLFHSRIAYACLAWGHSSDMSGFFKIQRRAL